MNEEINWSYYKISQDLPIAIVVHICSTKVPYKTVGKEFIADRPEIEREIKNGINNVSFIKLDIERFEYFALLGAEKTIQFYKPILQLELHDDNPFYNKIIEFLKKQREPEYDDEVISQSVQLNGRGGIVADMGDGSDDSAYKDAVRVVIESKKASTSFLQRKLRLGYGRAARLIETMEEQGIVSHADGNRPREVLVSSVDEVFNDPVASSAPSSAPTEDVYDDMPDEEIA